MNVTEIRTLDHPGIELYARLTEAQLRSRLEAGRGVFICESPKVIRTALESGLKPVSMLCESRHLKGDAAPLLPLLGDVPIYTGPRDLLHQLTGYRLTRGVLCAMRRPILPTLHELARNARRIVVIDSVSDTTNIGAIFRSAAALGIDAIALTPTSCDPLNRRAVRVSMGSVFLVPWTWIDDPVAPLRAEGFRTAALALAPGSLSICDPRLRREPRLALIMGTEGDGLAPAVIARADYSVRIPMHHGVDSLNVAAATAVACWELRAEA